MLAVRASPLLEVKKINNKKNEHSRFIAQKSIGS